MPNRLDEQTRTVLFILRFAYWLRILRKHTSFFMVNIVVTILRNFNHGLNRRSRELTIQASKYGLRAQVSRSLSAILFRFKVQKQGRKVVSA